MSGLGLGAGASQATFMFAKARRMPWFRANKGRQAHLEIGAVGGVGELAVPQEVEHVSKVLPCAAARQM